MNGKTEPAPPMMVLRVAKMSLREYQKFREALEAEPGYIQEATEAQITEVQEMWRAAEVIKAFCNKRTDDHACRSCLFHDNCGTEPYAWEV